MLHNTYESQTCSVARTLEIVGERWSQLIIRDAFLGIRRFDDFQRRLGIARNVLTARLAHLTEAGVLEKVQYSERPPRYEYRLTEMGNDLWPMIMAMVQFGDRHLAANGPPRIIEHRDCGGTLSCWLTCEKCGQQLTHADVVSRVGPGARGPSDLVGKA